LQLAVCGWPSSNLLRVQCSMKCRAGHSQVFNLFLGKVGRERERGGGGWSYIRSRVISWADHGWEAALRRANTFNGGGGGRAHETWSGRWDIFIFRGETKGARWFLMEQQCEVHSRASQPKWSRLDPEVSEEYHSIFVSGPAFTEMYTICLLLSWQKLYYCPVAQCQVCTKRCNSNFSH